jgi:hypothetical protein
MIAYVLSFAGFVSEVESHTFGFCRVLLVFFSIDVQLNDYDDRVLTKSDLLGRWAHFVLTIAAIIHDGNWHVGIDFAILMLILFAIESVMNPLPMTYRSVMIGAVSSVVHILIGCVLSRAGFENPALGLCHFLLVFFLVEVQLMGGMRRFFCPDITIPHHWVSFVLMDTLRTPGPWFVGYLSGIITGVLYWFRVLSYFAPSAQFFRRVEKRLFGDSLNRWMYVPAGDERGPVALEDELYSREPFGVFGCSVARKPESTGRCASGDRSVVPAQSFVSRNSNSRFVWLPFVFRHQSKSKYNEVRPRFGRGARGHCI